MQNPENTSHQAINTANLVQGGTKEGSKLRVSFIGTIMFEDALLPLIDITNIAADTESVNVMINATQSDLLVVDLDLIDVALFNQISAHAMQTQLQVFCLTSTLPVSHADLNQPQISFIAKSDALSKLIEKLNNLSHQNALHQKVALTNDAQVLSSDESVSQRLVDSIAADMHDAVGGLLSSMMLILYTQKEAINNGMPDHEHMHAQLDLLEDLVEQTSSEIKRICNQHR